MNIVVYAVVISVGFVLSIIAAVMAFKKLRALEEKRATEIATVEYVQHILDGLVSFQRNGVQTGRLDSPIIENLKSLRYACRGTDELYRLMVGVFPAERGEKNVIDLLREMKVQA